MKAQGCLREACCLIEPAGTKAVVEQHNHFVCQLRVTKYLADQWRELDAVIGLADNRGRRTRFQYALGAHARCEKLLARC